MERNAYITGFSLFLSLVLNRLIDIQGKLHSARQGVKQGGAVPMGMPVMTSAPEYVEGTVDALSMRLSGDLGAIGTDRLTYKGCIAAGVPPNDAHRAGCTPAARKSVNEIETSHIII